MRDVDVMKEMIDVVEVMRGEVKVRHLETGGLRLLTRDIRRGMTIQ